MNKYRVHFYFGEVETKTVDNVFAADDKSAVIEGLSRLDISTITIRKLPNKKFYEVKTIGIGSIIALPVVELIA